MKQEIHGCFTQELQTMHPDVIANINFHYIANVDGDYVDIISVYQIDESNQVPIRTTPRSEYESHINRFLANIRDHARNLAYKSSKKNESVK